MKCEDCQVDYPDHLVSLMRWSFPTKGYFIRNVCGICALKIKSEIYGTPLTKFNGPMAEKLRQEAIAFRKEHGL